MKLRQKDWDFRAIPKAAWADAIVYEYLRSSPPISHQIRRWLRQPVRIRKSTIAKYGESFDLESEFATRRAAITHFASIGRELPMSVREELVTDWPFAILTFRDWYFLFPAPWSRLPQGWVSPLSKICQWRDETPIEDFTGYLIRNDELKLINVYNESTPTKLPHVITIDWSFQKETIKDAFKKWLETARPSWIDERDRRGRKKVSPEKLKQLAAFRLQASGLSYSEIQTALIEERRKSKDENLVLPIYSTPQAWSNAVTAAKKHLTSVERQFSITSK